MKYELQSTQTFNRWLSDLKDAAVRNKVLNRLDRLSNGNFGDYKAIDAGLFELRFVFGAGLRIYYTISSFAAGGRRQVQPTGRY